MEAKRHHEWTDGDHRHRGIRILLAIAEPDTRSYVRRCLELHDREVDPIYETADGHRALETLEGTPVDLIVAETGLPGLDGVELCRRVRMAPRSRRTPILLILNEPRTREGEARLTAAGATAVLERPFNARGLCGLVDRLLRTRSPPS